MRPRAKKRLYGFIKILLVSSLILYSISGIVTGNGASKVLFSDNFDDNVLDNSKWTLDTVGSGNAFSEINQRAEFTTYGHGGYANGHAVLLSSPIDATGWLAVNISGTWWIDSGTAEVILDVMDAQETGRLIGVRYATYTRVLKFLSGTDTPVETSRVVPAAPVNFTIRLLRDRYEYYEEGALVREIDVSTLPHADILNGTDTFQLRIGGWDYSSFSSAIHIDEIVVASEAGGGPVANFTANTTSGTAPLAVQFNDTSTGNPVAWNWSFGDGEWYNTTDPGTRNVTHIFVAAGTYAVSLTVISAGGSDTATLDIEVLPSPSTRPVRNLDTGLGYDTIQDALNAPETLDGHTIIVDSGTYYESLSIGKSVSLIGNDIGGGKPVLHAGGSTAVTLAANGITFDGFVLDDTGTGIDVLSDYNTISNNTLIPRTNVGVYGIQIIGHHHNSIIGNNIHWYDTVSGTGYAIFLSGGSSYNTIEGNACNDNKRGVLLYSSSNSNIVANNTFARNIWDGICIWNSTNNTIYGNTLHSNNVGLKFWYATSGGNRIYQNNLINNTVNADTADSINIWHSPDPVSYTYRGTVFMNYTGNYWSDADIPDENGDGIGDTTHAIPSSGSDPYPLAGLWEGGRILPTIKPIAQFSANITSGNPPLSVQFLDESDCADPFSWYWDFGDGNTSSVQNPQHTYYSTGSYDVSLRVTNASGADTKVRAGYIQVTRAPALQGVEWYRTYGGAGWEYGNSIGRTSDGGYILAGYTNSTPGGDFDVYLVKTDADGKYEWNRTYGHPDEHEWGQTVIQAGDGGYFIAGLAGTPSSDVYLMRTNATGTELWNTSIGWAGDEEVAPGSSAVLTSDGLVAVGSTSSIGGGLYDILLLKVNEDGEEVWSRTFGGAGYEFGRALESTGDGFVIAGVTAPVSAPGNYDILIVRTDPDGTELWSTTFGGAAVDVVRSIKRTSDGGFILVGYTNSWGAGNYDVYLIKLNTTGEVVWSRTYGGAADDQGWSVIQTKDGGYAIAGFTNSTGEGEHDVYLIRTDENGNLLWSRTFGGDAEDWGRSVVEVQNGFVIGGYSASFDGSDYDLLLVKFSAPVYTITAIPGSGGTITPSGEVQANESEDVMFRIAPSAGYYTSDVLVDGYSQGAISTYTFRNVRSNHTIAAYFARTSSGGGGGGGGSSVLPSGEGAERAALEEAGEQTPVPGEAIAKEIFDLSMDWLVLGEADGGRTITIDTDGAAAAGYEVRVLGDSIEIICDQYTLIIEATGIVEAENEIMAEIAGITLVSGPVSAQLAIGSVQVFFVVDLLEYPGAGSIAASIVETAEQEVLDRVREALAAGNLELDAFAFYVRFDKTGIGETGEGRVQMYVPAAWVEERGGVQEVRVVRIGDDGALQILETTYAGTDDQGRMIFEALSPDGLSIFTLVTAKVKSAASQEMPTGSAGTSDTQHRPGTPIEIFASMVTWLGTNPLYTAVIVLLVVSALYAIGRHTSRAARGRVPDSTGPDYDGSTGARELIYSHIIGILNEIDEQLGALQERLSRPGAIITPVEGEGIVERFFVTCQRAEMEIKGAASEGHLTGVQIEHLNTQLRNAVLRMIELSRDSPVLQPLVEARVEAGG